MTHQFLLLALSFGGTDLPASSTDPGPPPPQAPPVQAPSVKRATRTPAAGNPTGPNGGGGVAIPLTPPPVLLGWRHWDGRGNEWFVPAGEVPAQRPEVRPVAASFRGPAFDPDHTCNVCGASQYVVSGAGPAPGTHTHRCGRCGNTWFH